MMRDPVTGREAAGVTAISELQRSVQALIDGDLVLLTDGQENASETTFEQLQQAFDESGISIFPVAYGSEADQKEATATLQAIVDFSHTILVKGSTGDIGQIFDNLSRYF